MESLEELPKEGGKVPPALLGDWREIPSEVLERREVRALLQKANEELSPIYREALVLRDIEELSIEETAGVLAIKSLFSEGTTASGLYHAAKGACA
jgi:RNA polymerase sigma-70 factor (ECF subfamily)